MPEPEFIAGERAEFSFTGMVVPVGQGAQRVTISRYRLVWSGEQCLWADERATQEALLARLEMSFHRTGGVPAILATRPVRPLGGMNAEEDALWLAPFKRFCTHYGCDPVSLDTSHSAAVGVPGLCEQAQTRHFISFAALQKWLDDSSTAGSVERWALRPLPTTPYVSEKATFRSVASDGFVLYAGDAYSVPSAYVAKAVWICRRGNHVVIRSQHGETLATYFAGRGQGQVFMQLAHFERGRRRIDRDLESLRRQFLAQFPTEAGFFSQLVAQRKQGAAASLREILVCTARHGKDNLRSAFRKCLDYNNFSHRFILGLLHDGGKAMPAPHNLSTNEQGTLF